MYKKKLKGKGLLKKFGKKMKKEGKRVKKMWNIQREKQREKQKKKRKVKYTCPRKVKYKGKIYCVPKLPKK